MAEFENVATLCAVVLAITPVGPDSGAALASVHFTPAVAAALCESLAHPLRLR